MFHPNFGLFGTFLVNLLTRDVYPKDSEVCFFREGFGGSLQSFPLCCYFVEGNSLKSKIVQFGKQKMMVMSKSGSLFQ